MSSTEELFGDRKRALEDSFFRKQDEKLIARLRAQRTEQEASRALAEASGVTDAAALGRLRDLGVAPETLAALGVVPLVAVAWADGRLEERERRAVLAGAEAAGVEPGSPAHTLFEGWLEAPPSAGMLEAWRTYTSALCSRLSATERETLRAQVLGRARAVAEAAGGFLGLGSRVSEAEEKMLASLERAFGA
jgi:hypothetical protein